MLTAELVRVRRDKKTGDLRINPIAGDGKLAARALELAETYLSLCREHVGRTREELDEALGQVQVAPRERLLSEGLRKLIEDRCQFDVAAGPPPDELRADVFSRAAAARQAGAFDRLAVLSAVAEERGLAVEELERCLYADLRGAHVLQAIEPLSPRALVEGYDLSQAQAVLLRAVRVRVEVECQSPAAYRLLFRKLKFLRLLFQIRPAEDGAYAVEIDGPFSLFESVTKYGLQLAMALPAIAACDRFDLRADVRWGKERQALTFRLEGGSSGVSAEGPRDGKAGEGKADRAGAADLPGEVQALLEGFRALGSPWTARPAPSVLSLPGVGVCVPDLLFEHGETGHKIHLEVLGFWSRAAVWRRVELVERGLRQPILFCVSSRLRVSEEALPKDVPAALYVYKGVISPRAILERLEALGGKITKENDASH